MDIETFFVARQQEISVPVHLYVLFDALHYAEIPEAPALKRHAFAAIALFDGTRDASLAEAGPWLVSWERIEPEMHAALAQLASGPNGVSWIISGYAMDKLGTELQVRLDARLPDGRTALLRYYDTRVMRHLASRFSMTERLQFFVPTFDWWLTFDGKAIKVHPHA